MWRSPTPILTALKLAYQLCPSVIAIGSADSLFHYPNFGISTENQQSLSGYPTPPAAFPAYLFADKSTTRKRYAEGAIPLLNGVIESTIFLIEDPVLYPTDAEVEYFGRQLLKEIGAQCDTTWSDHHVGMSSGPRPGQRAAGADGSAPIYRTITLTHEYGLNR